MSCEKDRIEALEKLAHEQAVELMAVKKEYAESLKRHGDFCAAVTIAAFGISDALTHEQIVASLYALRDAANHNHKTGESNADNQIEDMPQGGGVQV